MKKLLCALCLLAALAANVDAGWLYINVIVCEAPPAAIKWNSLVVEIGVWDEANPRRMILDTFNPTLGDDVVYSDHFLPGPIDMWNAWIFPGKERVYGSQNHKWYQIRWKDVAAYENKASDISTMHLDFEWRIDPDQSLRPDETTPLRLFQWQGRW